MAKLRTDQARVKLLALGLAGSERTASRAVVVVKRNYCLGRVRVQPRETPSLGCDFTMTFGDGPVIDGACATLFCA